MLRKKIVYWINQGELKRCCQHASRGAAVQTIKEWRHLTQRPGPPSPLSGVVSESRLGGEVVYRRNEELVASGAAAVAGAEGDMELEAGAMGGEDQQVGG